MCLLVVGVCGCYYFYFLTFVSLIVVVFPPISYFALLCIDRDDGWVMDTFLLPSFLCPLFSFFTPLLSIFCKESKAVIEVMSSVFLSFLFFHLLCLSSLIIVSPLPSFLCTLFLFLFTSLLSILCVKKKPVIEVMSPVFPSFISFYPLCLSSLLLVSLLPFPTHVRLSLSGTFRAARRHGPEATANACFRLFFRFVSQSPFSLLDLQGSTSSSAYSSSSPW